MMCPNCKCIVPNNVFFCMYCGHKFRRELYRTLPADTVEYYPCMLPPVKNYDKFYLRRQYKTGNFYSGDIAVESTDTEVFLLSLLTVSLLSIVTFLLILLLLI